MLKDKCLNSRDSFIVLTISIKKKACPFVFVFIAPVFFTPKLVISPVCAIKTQNSDAIVKFLVVRSVTREAKKVPTMMAIYVNIAMILLALRTDFSGTISGIRPYFEGPKIALCVAMRKRVQ